MRVNRSGASVSHRRVRTGVTLVELIVAIVVFSTMGLVVGAVTPSAAIAYRDTVTRSQLHEEACTTMERLVMELRTIDLNAAALPTIAPSIDEAQAARLVWNGSTMGVWLSGTNLLWTENAFGTTSTLQPDVSAFTVACFDESNATLSLPRSGATCYTIRRIQLTLTLTRAGVSETVRTKVYLRSTMSGAGT